MMNQWVVEVTEDDFELQVLQASHERPVLVDFWAGWCGPCKMLMPVLDAIANDYQGKVLLAKVDTDQEQKLAGQWGVRSLPTVKLFRNGQVVDEFMGVQPESVIRALIEKHLPRPSDPLLDEVEQALGSDDWSDKWLQKARTALEMDPDYPRAQLLLIQALLRSEELEEADQRLRDLPVSLRMSDEIKPLQARLQLLQQGGNQTEVERALRDNPQDCGLWLKYAASRISQGDWEQGLEAYLRVLEKGGANWREQARDGLLSAFDLVEDRALVNRYRKRMSAALF